MRVKIHSKAEGSTFFDTMRLSSFFRHCETDFFPNFFFIVPPINFWYFATEWIFKKSQPVSPFTFFGTMRPSLKLQKNSKKKISEFLVFWVLLLSPVVEKVVFVFLSLRYGADLGRSRLVKIKVVGIQRNSLDFSIDLMWKRSILYLKTSYVLDYGRKSIT